MKWIVILTTLLSLAAPHSRADEDMPIGETATSSTWGSPAEPSAATATPSAAASAKAKSRLKKSDDKATDYAPAQDLLLSAMSLIGVKYTWGGNTPESGLDCSGFIRYVFQNSMNLTLPRTAFEMAQTGKTIDKTDLKPGDLVFFNTLGRTFSHVGIYLGDNRFIHSPRAGRSVEVANMGQSYWTKRFTGARRIAEGGSSEGLNMDAILASSSRQKQASRVSAAVASNTETISSKPQKQCKKITTGKGRKQKTTLKCTTIAERKPVTAGKAIKTNSSKSKATKASGKKTAAKKPAATKKTNQAKTAKKTNNKPATKAKK